MCAGQDCAEDGDAGLLPQQRDGQVRGEAGARGSARNLAVRQVLSGRHCGTQRKQRLRRLRSLVVSVLCCRPRVLRATQTCAKHCEDSQRRKRLLLSFRLPLRQSPLLLPRLQPRLQPSPLRRLHRQRLWSQSPLPRLLPSPLRLQRFRLATRLCRSKLSRRSHLSNLSPRRKTAASARGRTHRHQLDR